MACNQNLFDVIVDEVRTTYALAGPAAVVATGIAAAIDTILVAAGTGALASELLSSDPQLQPELEASHADYIRTRTSVRTRALLDCIANYGDAGHGSRKPEDVIQVVNDELARAVRNFNALTQTPGVRTLVDSWGRTFSDVHNCIEEAIDDSMTERMEPGPRISVRRNKLVCIRYEGE